jgi:hypothetical protein
MDGAVWTVRLRPRMDGLSAAGLRCAAACKAEGSACSNERPQRAEGITPRYAVRCTLHVAARQACSAEVSESSKEYAAMNAAAASVDAPRSAQ